MSLFDGRMVKRVDFTPKPQPPTPHDFGYLAICQYCGTTREEVDDNIAPKMCPGSAPQVTDKTERERIWGLVVNTAQGG